MSYLIKNFVLDKSTLIVSYCKGYICRHCGLMPGTNCKLKEHISRNHLGPVKCIMCSVIVKDHLTLKKHKKSCYFKCNVPSCELKHSSEEKAYSHKTKYMKSMKL